MYIYIIRQTTTYNVFYTISKNYFPYKNYDIFIIRKYDSRWAINFLPDFNALEEQKFYEIRLYNNP